MVRLRIPELLEKKGWTTYAFWQHCNGKLSKSAAYRLAKGDFATISKDTIEVLCDVFGVEPRDLITRRK